MTVVAKHEKIAELQNDILRLQGFRVADNDYLDFSLGPITAALPNKIFPVGCIHEFLSSTIEDHAATSGFVSGLLSTLSGESGTVLWISASRTLFPPALKSFGLAPDHFIFIDIQKEMDVLWAMEEALKCSAISAVVGELREISFTQSRRLQLAVEQSKVTGFLLRNNFKRLNTTASVSRWKITSLQSEQIDDLPGIGFAKWKVELLRMRNGKTGCWNVVWNNQRFLHEEQENILAQKFKMAAG